MKSTMGIVAAAALILSCFSAGCDGSYGKTDGDADAGDTGTDVIGELDGADAPVEDAWHDPSADTVDLPPDPVEETADAPDLPPGDGGETVTPSSLIIADPSNPRWLMVEDGRPFFMAGPGDPEDFLYRGARNGDGTRSGDQMEIINKLKPTGANCLYFQAVRTHGGDAPDATHNPFNDYNDQESGINSAILDQWETWFSAMDEAGIVIFFFFYDDDAIVWETGDSVGDTEKSFIHALVGRFEHHDHLIWAVAEEYAEEFTPGHVINVAAEIRAADDRDHPIAVHKNEGLDFSEFAGDPNIDQFAIQYNHDTAGALHDGVVTAWTGAAGRYNLNMSEAADWGSGKTARDKAWAIAMGGAYVMVLGWDVISTPTSDLEDCGRLVGFMESTRFRQMSPRDDLANGGTQYVLADPPGSAIAYASSLSGDIGLKAMEAGNYDFLWLDIPSGSTEAREGIAVAAGDQTWAKPDGIGTELAVYIVSR